MRRRSVCVLLVASAIQALAGAAHAGDFDASGRYVPAADAVSFEDFSDPGTFVPDDLEPDCVDQVHFTVQTVPDALSGTEDIILDDARQCPERFPLAVPPGNGSYRATVWLRHGVLNGRILVYYPAETGRETVSVRMAPTGRATSDGWVELATNAFSVEGDLAPIVHLRASDSSDAGGLEIDALELVPDGEFTPCLLYTSRCV